MLTPDLSATRKVWYYDCLTSAGYRCLDRKACLQHLLTSFVFFGQVVPLAVTDANLVLGRLLPAYFPCIFGENEDEPLDVAASRQTMLKLTHEVCSVLYSISFE